MVEIDSPAAPGSGEPHVEAHPDGPILSWTEARPGKGHALMISRLVGDAWTGPEEIVERDSLFVNWADFGQVQATAPGTLAAHWLVRGPTGGVDYRIEVATSTDGGRSWSESWSPHEDGTPTEHGFVSHFGLPDGRNGLVWLDGRDYAAAGDESEGPPGAAHAHGADGPEMALRFRAYGPDDGPGEEVVLDERACDCCQTAAAITDQGPVVAFRDRSPNEVRDISIVRWTPAGWTAPAVLHADGWTIEGCPVNGPALDARGSQVVAAWYTAASGHGQVRAAFSSDGGRTFGDPLTVDDGMPEGRVDIVLGEDGLAWVSWLERTAVGADVRVRRLDRDAGPGPSVTVAVSSESRAAGFPRMAPDGSGGLVVAWTDPTEPATVRVARLRPIL